MSLAIMHSRAQIGVEAPAVSVEIHHCWLTRNSRT